MIVPQQTSFRLRPSIVQRTTGRPVARFHYRRGMGAYSGTVPPGCPVDQDQSSPNNPVCDLAGGLVSCAMIRECDPMTGAVHYEYTTGGSAAPNVNMLVVDPTTLQPTGYFGAGGQAAPIPSYYQTPQAAAQIYAQATGQAVNATTPVPVPQVPTNPPVFAPPVSIPLSLPTPTPVAAPAAAPPVYQIAQSNAPAAAVVTSPAPQISQSNAPAPAAIAPATGGASSLMDFLTQTSIDSIPNWAIGLGVVGLMFVFGGRR